MSAKYVHGEGTIKSAYVQIKRRASSSSFSIRAINQTDIDRRHVRETSRGEKRGIIHADLSEKKKGILIGWFLAL